MMTVADAFRYIAAPRFIWTRARLDEAALRHLVTLLFVTLALAILSGGVAGGIIAGTLEEIPANANDILARTDLVQMLLIGVIFAPIIEELIFRSWLGLPRSSLLGLPGLLCIMAIFGAAVSADDMAMVLVISIGLTALYIALARKVSAIGPADRAFARQRLFPVAFWGSTLAFALTHLGNFEGGLSATLAAPILLLAIIPQAVAGAMMGYVRMRFGLAAAIVFHAAYNAVLIGIAALALGLSAPGGPGEADPLASLSGLITFALLP